MRDWGSLEHAYGRATDLPKILGLLSPDVDNPAWNELWSRICHQETVYSASFAALVPLCERARTWSPRDRLMPLVLAGAILSSGYVKGDRAELLRPLDSTVAELRRLSRETLDEAASLGDVEFVHLLQAWIALDGDVLWGRVLDFLNDGELSGVCQRCGGDLFVVVGEWGTFLAVGDWLRDSQVRRMTIAPADAATLVGVQRRLYEEVAAAGRLDLAKALLHAFGCATCPSCDTSLCIPDAIAAAHTAT